MIKSHGPTTVAFVNGAPQGILWHDKDNWTMYVSPYMVVNSDRFTKHYYAGSQRIASKIGAGEFNNLYDASKACVTAGQKDYAERMNLITQSRNDYYAALVIPPGPPTAKGIYGEAEHSGSYGDYTITPLGNYDVPSGWPMKPYKRPYGGTPGPPVMYEKPSDPEDEGAGYGYSNAEELDEKDIYFYHSDHLGSTSYITDANGNATQFVCYKPYGEALVDEHNTSYEQPWKFNGKELDTETGLYYYGARYYEPVLAMWYGVDALSEKYPSMGGYVYCHANPITRVDVDGNWDIKVHTSSDRGNNPYGVLIVTNRNGKEIYRTVVRATGTGGRNRSVSNSDTPQGRYKILEYRKTDNKRYNRTSFGPNDLLALSYEGGEGSDGGSRNGIHVHGGRQEGKYANSKDLKATHGCLRINDQDIADLKQITDALQVNDTQERPGVLTVFDDLRSPVEYNENRHNAASEQFPMPSSENDFILYEDLSLPCDNTYVKQPYIEYCE